MNRLILILALLAPALSFAQASPAGTPKTVFIIVDGIPFDVIDKLDLPHIRSIAKADGFARALVGGEKNGYSQTPTISAVGYNSVLTGTWVNKHNVWGNDITAPNYHYFNIFRLLKMQSPEKKIGIFSSWLDNRTKLVGEGLAGAGNTRFDYHFDGLELDTLNYPHDKEKRYMHFIDEKVTAEAARVIRADAPDLSWVYLEYTDDVSHRHGDSPEFYQSVKEADARIGRIWEAVQYRRKKFGEDWLVVITTDHGRDAETGKGHGGQSDRERAGWIVTNARNLNDRFKRNESAIVDIMPTIARFMNIAIPGEIQREVDGVPLAGKISLTDPSISYRNGEAQIVWKAADRQGTVKVWVAATNNFKAGNADRYELLAEVPLTAQQVSIDLRKWPSSFYKVVLEAPYNTVNRWIMAE